MLLIRLAWTYLDSLIGWWNFLRCAGSCKNSWARRIVSIVNRYKRIDSICSGAIPCVIPPASSGFWDPVIRPCWIKKSIASSGSRCIRFRWLLKLSWRGQILSWDLQPNTRQWYACDCITLDKSPGCLVCKCLFKSLTVLKPSFLWQLALVQRYGFAWRKWCNLYQLVFQ